MAKMIIFGSKTFQNKEVREFLRGESKDYQDEELSEIEQIGKGKQDRLEEGTLEEGNYIITLSKED